MTEEKKEVFSRENILKKQQVAQEDLEKRTLELRKAFEDVASTVSGEKVLQYFFLICGGDSTSVRGNKEGEVSANGTLIALGTKGVWETARYNMSSETVIKIERKSWENK